MTKEERITRKDKTFIIRRINKAFKSSKVSNKIIIAKSDEDLTALLDKCTRQNQIIDVMLRNNKSIDDTAIELVKRNLCKDEQHAKARIKRHAKRDILTAISKRAIALTV